MNPPQVRVAFAIAACGLSILVAGCGGSSKSGSTALKDVPTNVTGGGSLLGSAQSAGRAQSYVPTGKIIADSGFRPQVNGFDFENYGNGAGPVNMTAANVVDLFGSQVCVTGSGPSCALSPAARHWLEQVNASMANGHCMGFSVSALRFFSGDLRPAAFGAPHTFSLPVRGNDKLQSLIAEDFAYQDLPAVTTNAIHGTPAGRPGAAVHELFLQGREERLRDRVKRPITRRAGRPLVIARAAHIQQLARQETATPEAFSAEMIR